jgi:hypothetical protein
MYRVLSSFETARPVGVSKEVVSAEQASKRLQDYIVGS